MNLSLKRTNLFALEIFALAVALVVVSSPYVHGQELAHLNPIPKPGKSVVTTAVPSHPHAPGVHGLGACSCPVVAQPAPRRGKRMLIVCGQVRRTVQYLQGRSEGVWGLRCSALRLGRIPEGNRELESHLPSEVQAWSEPEGLHGARIWDSQVWSV